MTKNNNISDEKFNPAQKGLPINPSPDWPVDDPNKRKKFPSVEQSQDADRHAKIRHEDSEK